MTALEVIAALKRGSCWCELGIGNPMVRSHDAACLAAQDLMAMSSTAIIAEIDAERDRQDAQWGGVEHDDCHSSSDWMDFIDHQLDRWHEEGDSRVRLIKIAALAIAGLESLGRRSPAGEP